MSGSIEERYHGKTSASQSTEGNRVRSEEVVRCTVTRPALQLVQRDGCVRCMASRNETLNLGGPDGIYSKN